MTTFNEIEAKIDVIKRVRRDIHSHPELCYQEHRTSGLVADLLRSWDIPVHRGLGGTGVVGVIKKGASNRAIALRADMDALPIHEVNTFTHASRHPGKMHACGHDGHIAILLAAAEHLRHVDFDGCAYFIFQPAEEGGAGARAMIDDGLFELFPADNVFAFHNWPNLEAGKIAVSAGPVMAASSEFSITFKGRGGHAALPQIVDNVLLAASNLVMSLQGLLTHARQVDDSTVVSATMINGGEARNVFPERCSVEGTVRTFLPDNLDMLELRMASLAENIASAYGCTSTFEFFPMYPATINTACESTLARTAFSHVVGEENVLAQRPAMTGEDFAFMLQKVPGAYIFIGNGNGDHRPPLHGEGPCTLHNPTYDFNDDIISVGAACWVELVETYLRPGKL